MHAMLMHFGVRSTVSEFMRKDIHHLVKSGCEFSRDEKKFAVYHDYYAVCLAPFRMRKDIIL